MNSTLVRYSDDYIDRLFEEKDHLGVYQVISVLGKQMELPEEFWLFNQVYPLVPYRGGVWQHFEGLQSAEKEKLEASMRRFGLDELADRHHKGSLEWEDETKMKELDDWMDEVYPKIHEHIFGLITSKKNILKRRS